MRLITGRDVECAFELYKRWGFVLVVNPDDPGEYFMLYDEEKLRSNDEIVLLLQRIIGNIKEVVCDG